MQDLRLLGVHQDGEHLLLADGEGSRYQLPVDEALRAAVRRDPPHLSELQADRDSSLRPRDVQSLIRAGVSAEAVAQRAGWPVDKVRRYEGPILAEREYVAGLARGARLRGRSVSGGVAGGGGSTAPVLSARVAERLSGRGVDTELVTWDSWRAEEGPWTVVLTFAAGGRQRQASWHFDPVDRVVAAVDDEARWLSEDENSAGQSLLVGDSGGSHGSVARPSRDAPEGLPSRTAAVYDVEAEGGVESDFPTTAGVGADRPVDLMTAMRQRSGARGRRSTGAGRALRDGAVRQDVLADGLDTELPLDDGSTPQAGADQAAGTEDSSPDPVPAHESEDRSETAAATATAPTATAPTAAPPAADAGPDATPSADAGPDDAAPSVPADTSKAAPRRGRRTGRPSVPSWDDIMFGTKQGSDT